MDGEAAFHDSELEEDDWRVKFDFVVIFGGRVWMKKVVEEKEREEGGLMKIVVGHGRIWCWG